MDGQGDLFIDDGVNDRIVEVKADGTKQTLVTGLDFPQGVAVDSNGDVFGADTLNNRVVEARAGVPVTITPGTPTVQAQSVSTLHDVNATITLAGTDPDTPALPLTYKVTSGPSHGTLKGTAPSLKYVPAAGYAGPDSFSFTASNGTNTSAPATVSIAVTPSATSINLTASAATLAGGQSETLTAIVTAAGSTPTGGTVTFLDGGKAIGTASLSKGKASLTTSGLTLGAHDFTASYGGTVIDNPSASGVEPTSTASAVGSGLYDPQSLAVDGSGDVFVAASTYPDAGLFVEVTPGGADDRGRGVRIAPKPSRWTAGRRVRRRAGFKPGRRGQARRRADDRRLGAVRPLGRRGGRQWRRVHRRHGQQTRRRGQARRRRRPSPRG